METTLCASTIIVFVVQISLSTTLLYKSLYIWLRFTHCRNTSYNIASHNFFKKLCKISSWRFSRYRCCGWLALSATRRHVQNVYIQPYKIEIGAKQDQKSAGGWARYLLLFQASTKMAQSHEAFVGLAITCWSQRLFSFAHYSSPSYIIYSVSTWNLNGSSARSWR